MPLSFDDKPQRTAGELAAIVVATALTVVACVAFLFGPVLIAAWWVSREGITPFTVAWIAIAAAWVVVLVVAAARNAETRGWIAVGLFGWVGPLAAAVRRLGRSSAKSQA